VKGQVLTSTFDNTPASTPQGDSSEPESPSSTETSSSSSSAPSDSDTDSDTDSNSSSPSEKNSVRSAISGHSAEMGRPRHNAGRMKRNTALVNGANSMPLGTNNRMASLGQADNKRKRSEEPAEEPARIEKKSKGVNGNAVTAVKKLSTEQEDKDVSSVATPAKDKKGKKEKKAEAVSEPLAKQEKAKKEKKAEVAIEPIVETVVAEKEGRKKKIKKEKKIKAAATPVVELPAKEEKRSKKGSKVAETEFESSSPSDSVSDGESSADSQSSGDLDSDFDISSDTDSLDLNVEDSTDDEMYADDKSELRPIENARPANIIKVVDGVAIPAPEPIVREKKTKVPAKVLREQRKQAREEEARRNAIEMRKKAIAEGTFDFEADKRRKKERQVDRIVKWEIIRRENAGEFGPKLPHPSILLQIEKEISKDFKRKGMLGDEEAEKKAMHARLIVGTFYACHIEQSC
jgi:hypothetical protein